MSDTTVRNDTNNFVTMYRQHIDDLTLLARTNGGAYDFLMFLIQHMDSGNALCVSMHTLTEIMGVSRVSLSKRVKYLKDNGWIDVLKAGTCNIYMVNPAITWTTFENQKDYCQFNARILISGSENSEFNNKDTSVQCRTISSEFIEHARSEKELVATGK